MVQSLPRGARCSALPQVLRLDAQSAIETRGGVLPRDDLGQLHDLLFAEVIADAGEQLVAGAAAGGRHGIGIGQRGLLVSIKQRGGVVVSERAKLFVADSQFAADRSVEVLSKLAADQCGDPSIDQRLQRGRNQCRGTDPTPHPACGVEDRGAMCVDQMVVERSAPLLSLRFEHRADARLGFRWIDFPDACHGETLPEMSPAGVLTGGTLEWRFHEKVICKWRRWCGTLIRWAASHWPTGCVLNPT